MKRAHVPTKKIQRDSATKNWRRVITKIQLKQTPIFGISVRDEDGKVRSLNSQRLLTENKIYLQFYNQSSLFSAFSKQQTTVLQQSNSDFKNPELNLTVLCSLDKQTEL